MVSVPPTLVNAPVVPCTLPVVTLPVNVPVVPDTLVPLILPVVTLAEKLPVVAVNAPDCNGW